MLTGKNNFIKKNFITFIIFSVCIWFVASQVELADSLQQVNISSCLTMVFLTLGVLLLLALQFQILISVFEVKLKFREWFGLTVVNTMANYFLPAKTGSVIRGLYLKRNHSFPLAHYASLLASSQFISLAVTTTVGVAILKFFLDGSDFILNALIYSLLFAIPVLAGFRYIGMKLIRHKLLSARVINLVRLLVDGFSLLSKSKRELFVYCMLALLMLVVWTIRLQVCLSSVGTDVSFEKVLLIQMLVNISFLFSFTPGNIGLKEGATAFAASQVGVDPGIAVLASLIERTFSMSIVLILGVVCSRSLMDERVKH